MPPWTLFGVVLLAASLAFGATLGVWRRRTSTPRTVSLVLSAGSCAALIAAASPVVLQLPESLCTEKMVRDERALSAQLAEELSGWRWWFRPCRRLSVTPNANDFAGSLDVAELSALAARSNIAVDVVLGETAPAASRRLELFHDERDFSLPLETPVHLAETKLLSPRFSDSGVAPRCRLDSGEFRDGATLFELLKNRREVFGFHKLECREPSRSDETGAVGYVRLKPAAARIVSSDAEVVAPQRLLNTEYFSSEAARSYRLRLAVPSTESQWLSEPGDRPSVLLLDRPRNPESCRRAREVLTRGGIVVVAMPDPVLDSAGACDWLPARSVDGLEFDRTPQLTFLFDDDFAKDLRHAPSFRLDNPGPFESVDLPESLALQRANARTLCERRGESCPRSFPEWPTVLGGVSSWTRLPERPLNDAERIWRSSVPYALSRFAERRRETTLRENEQVVVYTHDPLARSANDPAVRDFLERTAARVEAILIQDLYGDAIRKLGIPRRTTPRGSQSAHELVADPDARFHEYRVGCKGLRCVGVTSLLESARLGARPRPPHAWSRFSRPSQSDETNAPVQFGWWRVDARDAAQLTPAVLAETTTNTGLKPRLLAAGTMVGRGHLLFLTFSPLESWVPHRHPWRGGVLTHEKVLGGPALIETLYASSEELLAALDGPIMAVELRPDGALWIRLLGESLGEAVPELVEFTAGAASPRGHLVDFDTARGEYTYAVPAAELEALSRCGDLTLDLAGAPMIYACPPTSADNADAILATVNALKLLAWSSGGRDIVPGGDPRSAEDSIAIRSLGLCALALFFLVSWTRRGGRRLLGAWVYRALRRSETTAQRRFDPPDAVVAAAGDWAGRVSTWPRTGAFGGFRALEPGDRVSAIVLDDLLMFQRGTHPVLPRVVQRIEEAAPAVTVLLNLGASMRVPERLRSSKALFAGRVAMQVAASAWKIRGKVTIRTIGNRGDRELIAATCQSPGHEHLLDQLRDRLRRGPARDEQPWDEALPDSGALVYISDFQLEEDRALMQWLARLEGEGVRVGAVMVYSPMEFTMIEGGRLAGSGVWVDRADWDPDDVFAAFSQRRDTIERAFDEVTTGGLVTVATSFSQEDIELALEEGRLLEILR